MSKSVPDISSAFLVIAVSSADTAATLLMVKIDRMAYEQEQPGRQQGFFVAGTAAACCNGFAVSDCFLHQSMAGCKPAGMANYVLRTESCQKGRLTDFYSVTCQGSGHAQSGA